MNIAHIVLAGTTILFVVIAYLQRKAAHRVAITTDALTFNFLETIKRALEKELSAAGGFQLHNPDTAHLPPSTHEVEVRTVGDEAVWLCTVRVSWQTWPDSPFISVEYPQEYPPSKSTLPERRSCSLQNMAGAIALALRVAKRAQQS